MSDTDVAIPSLRAIVSDPQPAPLTHDTLAQLKEVVGINRRISRQLLMNCMLYGQIRTEDRSLYGEILYEAFRVYGVFQYNQWPRLAYEAGVPREQLAELVMEKLRNADSTVASEFLRYGPGPVARETVETVKSAKRLPGRKGRYRLRCRVSYWSLLSDAQLMEALRICMRYEPSRFLDTHDPHSDDFSLLDKIRLRLSEEKVNVLLIELANESPLFIGASRKKLGLLQLPVLERIQAVRRMGDVPVNLLLHVSMSVGSSGGFDPVAEFPAAFNTAKPDKTYGIFWRILRRYPPMDPILVVRIEQELREQAEAAGFVIGFVEAITDGDSRRYQVRSGGKIYIHQPNDKYPVACPGDRVIIDTATLPADQGETYADFTCVASMS